MYRYEDEKAQVFTEQGQIMFLKIRDRIKKALSETGAITIGNAITGRSGSSFTMLACVDRLVELGEIVILHRSPTQLSVIVGGNHE